MQQFFNPDRFPSKQLHNLQPFARCGSLSFPNNCTTAADFENHTVQKSHHSKSTPFHLRQRAGEDAPRIESIRMKCYIYGKAHNLPEYRHVKKIRGQGTMAPTNGLKPVQDRCRRKNEAV